MGSCHIRFHVLILAPIVAILALGIILYGWRRRNPAEKVLAELVFLGFLTSVASVVVFPIDTDSYFIEQMRLHNSVTDGINLIPFATLQLGDGTGQALRQLLLNVVLGIPFGMSLPFLGVRGLPRTLALGALFAMGIEVIQLGLNAVYQFDYRAVDINDALANFAGVAIGLAAYRAARFGYRRLRLTSDDVGYYLDSVFSERRTEGETADPQGCETSPGRQTTRDTARIR